MKKVLLNLMLVSAIALTVSSCKKTATTEAPATAKVSAETKAKITKLGFGTSDVRKTEDGYLVEGDINLTDELLNSVADEQLIRVGTAEQYRTTNLVTKGLPKTFKILVRSLGTAFEQGTDLAIARYNALGLKMTFSRVSSGKSDITIQGFNQGPSGGYITLGSSGFPTNGAPYGTIKMNTNQYAYVSNPDVNYVGSVIQHELGHCIGMRHTDYYDRSISCGGATSNEGASNIGAILIPGTPSTATNSGGSWMLACSDGGDRTFNSADVVGLNYLYK